MLAVKNYLCLISCLIALSACHKPDQNDIVDVTQKDTSFLIRKRDLSKKLTPFEPLVAFIDFKPSIKRYSTKKLCSGLLIKILNILKQ